jgi:hypothetical protein
MKAPSALCWWASPAALDRVPENASGPQQERSFRWTSLSRTTRIIAAGRDDGGCGADCCGADKRPNCFIVAHLSELSIPVKPTYGARLLGSTEFPC